MAGPTRHSLTEMHRSTDDTTGANIAVDKVPVTDGAGGFTYEDYSNTADAILRYGGGAEWYDAHAGAAVGATETIDLANGNVHRIILDVNTTLTFTGAVASIDGQAVASGFLLIVEQDGSGGNTVTWPVSVVWPDGVAPTLDTTGGAVEILAFTTTDGGTVWHGVHSGSGGSALTVEDEGTPLATAATTLDFVGPLVTASGAGAEKTITVTGALDDLTDVTITAAAAADRLRYNGTAWVDTTLIWQPLTNGDTTTPELIFASGDVIMVEA